MSPQHLLHDHTGRPWQLDQQLAAGGEGIVYTVAGQPILLAKLYKKRPPAATVEKLQWMIHTPSEHLRRVAAWPIAILHEKPGGPAVGFLMPRLTGYQPIHHLYIPGQRWKYFPRVDWSFLVRAAHNCAAAFEIVHRSNCLMADVNQSNVFVSERALIGLIDCDSFQVSANGRLLLCEVGVDYYTPPELQGRSYSGLVRSMNHDRFGLAIVLFQLLFMGRHPYVGVFLGKGELPAERAIREFRFAYGSSAAVAQMTRPPQTLPLKVLSPELARLFERAFMRGSDEANARPAPGEWCAALSLFEKQLLTCPKDSGHKIPRHLKDCPWCDLVAHGVQDYFQGVAAFAAVFNLDAGRMAGTWERVKAIPFTPFTYDRARLLPREDPMPAPLPDTMGDERTVHWVLGSATGGGLFLLLGALFLKQLACFGLPILLVFGVWWFVYINSSAFMQEKRMRQRGWEEAQNDVQAAEHQMDELSSAYESQFKATINRLDGLRRHHMQLQPQYVVERQQLERNQEVLCREQHLRTCFITDHAIPGIGTGRERTLASYGIETAFDVEETRIRTIKGFKDVLTQNLLRWRTAMLAEFRFDPRTGVPEGELRKLALKFKQQQDGVFASLEQGLTELQAR